MMSVASRCLFGALLAGAASGALAQAPTAAQLDAVVQAHMPERKIASVAVAVMRDGQTVLARARGDAKLREEPAQAGTVRQMQSGHAGPREAARYRVDRYLGVHPVMARGRAESPATRSPMARA